MEIVKAKNNNKSGTDPVTINNENHQIIYIIDLSAYNELGDNLKDGDGFGIRYAYKFEELNGEQGEKLIRTHLREIAGDNDYFETRIRKVLQNYGIRPENLLGPNLASQLKRMHDDDVMVSRLGRTRGYKTNKNNGGKSSTNDKR